MQPPCQDEPSIFPHSSTAVTDDLRDYRFYTPDMTHPTEQAADYVYHLFEEAYTDNDTRRLAKEGLARSRRLAHRQLFTHQL